MQPVLALLNSHPLLLLGDYLGHGIHLRICCDVSTFNNDHSEDSTQLLVCLYGSRLGSFHVRSGWNAQCVQSYMLLNSSLASLNSLFPCLLFVYGSWYVPTMLQSRTSPTSIFHTFQANEMKVPDSPSWSRDILVLPRHASHNSSLVPSKQECELAIQRVQKVGKAKPVKITVVTFRRNFQNVDCVLILQHSDK